MLNEVKHLYNKDSSLTLRMTASVIIYFVTYYFKVMIYRLDLRNYMFTVMLNEVKHLYNKDSSLALRMTVSVIIYIVTFFIA